MRRELGARLGVLMLAAFVETLGNFLILALLPYYGLRYGASPSMVGALVAAFALAQMLTAPLWGRLSDRVGRRPVMVAGLALAAVSYLVFAFADSLWLLMVTRLVQGIGGGTVSVVFAYVSDAVAPEERAEGIGWLTAATSLAAMCGPAIGSFASRYSPQAPGLVVAAIAALTALALWLLLPRTAREMGTTADGIDDLSGSPEATRGREGLARSLASVLSQPLRPANSLIWIYSLSMVAFTALTAVIALYLDERFGIGEQDIWIFFVYLGGASVIVRLFALGPLVRRFGEPSLLRAGVLLLAVALVLVSLPRGLVLLSLIFLLVPIGTSLLFPCTTALVTRHTDEETVGQAMGVQQFFGGFSRIVGPLWAGILYERVSIGSPFWVTGLLLLFAGGVALLLPLAAPEEPGGAPETS